MKRIIFIIGHYGSGKSEVSLNLAVQKNIDYVIDLDIINPYFRAREQEKLLQEKGIKVVSSTIPDSLGSDLPFISREAFVPFLNDSVKAIYDFAGEIAGLTLVKQFSDYIKPDEVAVYVCINCYRDETSDFEKIIKLVKKFEEYSNLKVEGLINNSNLLNYTTCEDVLKAQKIIQTASKSLQIPIILTSGMKEAINTCEDLEGEKLSLDLMLRKEWM